MIDREQLATEIAEEIKRYGQACACEIVSEKS